MQFLLKALVTIAVAATFAQAAEKPESGITIPLTRRKSHLSNGEELDLQAVVARMGNIQRKYKRSMDNYKPVSYTHLTLPTKRIV